MRRPGVDLVRHPADARELVLLAHGGEERSHADPHLWRPALLRMWPFARAARSVAPQAAIGFLRYRFRGWNDDGDAAADLRTVLDELPPVISRVLLIGHSMGGRAVVAAGDHPRVAGVLGLAPWLPRDEPLVMLHPPVTFVHGTDDTITSAAGTAAYAQRLRAAGVEVTTYSLAGEGHAMLRRAKDWDRLVTEFVQGKPAGGGDEHWPAVRDQAVRDQAVRGQVVSAVGDIVTARLRMPVKERFRAE